VFGTGKILLGLAIVENAYDETMRIVALPGPEILSREPELLSWPGQPAAVPVEKLDVLIVDRLEKHRGTGMDTNVIGRIRIHGNRTNSPQIGAIVVTDLTEESHGNATGVGLADVTTRRLFNKIDFHVTNRNVVTSSFLERGKIPLVAGTDAEAVEFALRSIGAEAGAQPRVLRIRDTLHLGQLYASDAILEELSRHTDIHILVQPSRHSRRTLPPRILALVSASGPNMPVAGHRRRPHGSHGYGAQFANQAVAVHVSISPQCDLAALFQEFDGVGKRPDTALAQRASG
jgi:hypothetical protein